MKIPDFNNATLTCQIRYWLIKVIAGKRSVLLNTRIDIVTRESGCCAHVENVSGFLIHSNHFEATEDKMVRIFGKSGPGCVHPDGCTSCSLCGFKSEPSELFLAAEAWIVLRDKIRNSGRPPHTDFWHQSFFLAEARLRSAVNSASGSNA